MPCLIRWVGGRSGVLWVQRSTFTAQSMPRAGPSRQQRRPSQAQTQRHGRSQRRLEEDDDEEIALENYEYDDEHGMEDAGTVRATCSPHRLHFLTSWARYRT